MNAADLRHRWVRFRVNDICVPAPVEVLEQMFGDRQLEGEVVDFTGSGVASQVFVVVRVENLPALLVVPIAKIRVIGGEDERNDV